MYRYLFAPIALLGLAAPAMAQTVRQGSLTIDGAWTRQTAPGQSIGGGFMRIANRGKAADRLLSGTSSAAAKVEIHTMSMEGGVMRMRPLSDGLAVPAGGKVELKPGGYHIMLIGLKKPLALGSRVPVILRFQRAGSVTVQLQVNSISHGTGAGK